MANCRDERSVPLLSNHKQSMKEPQNDFEAHLDPPPNLIEKIQAILKTPVPAGEHPSVTIARTQQSLRALGISHISSFAEDEDEGGPDGEGF